MMEKKQEPDRLIPCAGKCGETFVNPWPNDYCHRCGAAVEGDGATIPDLRSELAAVKAENLRKDEAVAFYLAHWDCDYETRRYHGCYTGLDENGGHPVEWLRRAFAALTPPKAEKPKCASCEATDNPPTRCPTCAMPGVPQEKGCKEARP